MGAAQDTEITLGTGKLLGIFFILAVICAAFFSMGYLFGRNSSTASGSTTIVSTVPAAGGAPAVKPSAGGSKTSSTASCPAGSANCNPSGSGPDSSFYSAVNAKEPVVSQTPAAQVSSTSPEAKPGNTSDPKPAGTVSYMVQVAAVSRQEDADILVNALRKKQYPVFVAANLPGDSLFHVQVGPFSDFQEADAMRTRLANDGYNAIVKK
jgi:DedD protein